MRCAWLTRMLHIPILRKGVPYRSLDTVRTPHYRTREDFVEISQANVGLIRRDLLDQRSPHEALAAIPTIELIAISRRAADIFLNETLPVRLLAMLQGQVSPRINAVGTMVFSASIGLVVLAQLVIGRRLRMRAAGLER